MLAMTVWLSEIAVAELAPDVAGEQQFQEQVQPLLEKYCFDCHGNDVSEGDLTLDMFQSADEILPEQETWQKVIQKLQVEAMPPEGAEQPSAEERQFLIHWIEETLAAIDCVREARPGRTTIRRLNRYEYRNTIRDWLDVDYQATVDFPADDVGYGFDNIGDVLSLPPSLLEKYFAAAEAIADQAALKVSSKLPSVIHKRGVEIDGGQGGGYADGGRILASVGEMSTEVELPTDANYEIAIIAFGHQASDEPVKMSLRIDDRELRQFEVEVSADRRQMFRTVHRFHTGKQKLAIAFLNDFYDPGKGDRNLIVHSLEVRGPIAGELPQQEEPLDVTHAILQRWAMQGFRRPASEQEMERLFKLYQLGLAQGEGYVRSVQLALQSILVSPYFLFRVEPDPQEGQSQRTLNDFELATRLSYFLWSSMPDDTLFALAKKGALRIDGVLEGQVRRMLRDSKAQALAENFAGQWLNLGKLAQAEPDPDRFPEFDEALRQAMKTETELFFTEFVIKDLNILDFLDANFTFLNGRLARHYKISDVDGEEFRKVSLLNVNRSGVLSHASILTLTSNPTRTSPVKRGKWILENILGTPPPDPPPGVEALPDDDDDQLTGSLREQMEQHRAKPICASCHKLMDPLGFGFENFDAIGAWRERDGKLPIVSSGVLPTGEAFEGPQQLSTLLRQKRQERFCRCLVEKMLIYALGRGLEYYDRCAVDEIMKTMAASDYKFSSLVMGIVNSDAFQNRGIQSPAAAR